MKKKAKAAKPLPDQVERAKRGAASMAHKTVARPFKDKTKYDRKTSNQGENDAVDG